MNLFLKGEIMSMAQLKYKRVLLKISGEALAGDKHFGFDFDVVSKVCDVIKKCTDMGVQMGVVIGGGNFWRGVKNGEGYIERTRADHMGMLATAMNCMAVADVLEQKGVDVRVQTALEIKEVAEPYIRARAIRHLEKGRVVLFGCGIAGIAAYELLHTAGENVPADFYWGLVTSVVMQEIWLFWERASGVHAFPISTVTLFRWILVMGAFLSAVVYYGKEKPFTFHDVAVTIVGGIVFPAMYSCIFLLRMDENYGKLYVLAPFCVAFVGDALSMYFGMWFGKRKMAPHVSPHKTWAGAIGGPIGSALALVLLGVVGKAWLGYAPNYLMLILVGVVANIFGQLGDLSMSLVKREAGIKDYSHLFLTHGGMLDRFDSTLFIAPVVWAAVCGGLL